jgi:hypothetical protein
LCVSALADLAAQIELKLAKNSPDNWTSLLGAPGGASSLARPGPSSQPAASSSSQPSEAGLSAPPALQGVGLASNVPRTGGPEKVNAQRRNWDKVIEDELEENDDSKDPVSDCGVTTCLFLCKSLIFGTGVERRRGRSASKDVLVDIRQRGPGHPTSHDQELYRERGYRA